MAKMSSSLLKTQHFCLCGSPFLYELGINSYNTSYNIQLGQVLGSGAKIKQGRPVCTVRTLDSRPLFSATHNCEHMSILLVSKQRISSLQHSVGMRSRKDSSTSTNMEKACETHAPEGHWWCVVQFIQIRRFRRQRALLDANFMQLAVWFRARFYWMKRLLLQAACLLPLAQLTRSKCAINPQL